MRANELIVGNEYYLKGRGSYYGPGLRAVYLGSARVPSRGRMSTDHYFAVLSETLRVGPQDEWTPRTCDSRDVLLPWSVREAALQRQQADRDHELAATREARNRAAAIFGVNERTEPYEDRVPFEVHVDTVADAARIEIGLRDLERWAERTIGYQRPQAVEAME